MTRHGADTVEKDFAPHSSYFEPLLCEYVQVWETRAAMSDRTSGEPIVVHRSYSCVLFFCQYPDKKCKVKQP